MYGLPFWIKCSGLIKSVLMEMCHCHGGCKQCWIDVSSAARRSSLSALTAVPLSPMYKYVCPYLANMYTGCSACCPLVSSHGEHADGTDRRTDAASTTATYHCVATERWWYSYNPACTALRKAWMDSGLRHYQLSSLITGSIEFKHLYIWDFVKSCILILIIQLCLISAKW